LSAPSETREPSQAPDVGAIEAVLARIRWDAQGLVTAIAQEHLGGAVRMVAWMNAEALAITLQTRRATFWSRSRGRLWTKGETSGNALVVRDVALDCDGDSVLLLVDATGPSCHTGAESCFFAHVAPAAPVPPGTTLTPAADAEPELLELRDGAPALPVLEALGAEIEARKASSAQKSYTRTLLDGGSALIGKKLREEADELARAVADESDERVASEAADLLYHAMVALAARGLSLRDAAWVLAARRGTSGLDEKRARGTGAK
jgi:phosphoribosyl-ATP pyrophosphohydrolase/phosphoribosyl-AMP cyclohydrolase